MLKVYYDNINANNGDDKQQINFDQNSLLELLAQVS